MRIMSKNYIRNYRKYMHNKTEQELWQQMNFKISCIIPTRELSIEMLTAKAI